MRAQASSQSEILAEVLGNSGGFGLLGLVVGADLVVGAVVDSELGLAVPVVAPAGFAVAGSNGAGV